MRCHICDRTLSEAEVVLNKEIGCFEPCSTCLEIAFDTAFSQGFSPDYDPEETTFGSGAVPTLEDETFRSYYDHSDIHTPETGYNT